MIRVECGNCGARLRGPEKSAGRTIRCPKCGQPVSIPVPADEPELLPDDEMGPVDAYGTDEPVLPRTVARPPAANHDNAPSPKKPKKKKKKKSDGGRWISNDGEGISNTDVVICLACPGIGCIAGILYLIMGRSKGLQVLGLAVLGNIAWVALRIAYELATRQ